MYGTLLPRPSYRPAPNKYFGVKSRLDTLSTLLESSAKTKSRLSLIRVLGLTLALTMCICYLSLQALIPTLLRKLSTSFSRRT